MSAITAIPAMAYPLPGSSQIGVDLRGIHPKSSQFGVDFSDLVSIGVGFRGFGAPINRSPDYRITRSRMIRHYHLFAILSRENDRGSRNKWRFIWKKKLCHGEQLTRFKRVGTEMN
jgi:hypothetical protein